jgi:putative spermidine/putrescine transport system ATP-binding protein
LRGTVNDISFLGSIVRLRVRLGDGATPGGADAGTTIALDTFNEPHLTLPPLGGQVTISFPHEACFVLGSAHEGAVAAAEVAAEIDAEV